MTIDMAVELGQQALTMVLMLSGPMLFLGLVVGLIVSIFQATTQIQEATLSFVPKIIAVLFAIVLFGPWILITATNFTKNLFMNMNQFIK